MTFLSDPIFAAPLQEISEPKTDPSTNVMTKRVKIESVTRASKMATFLAFIIRYQAE